MLKRSFDFVFAALALLVTSPIFAFAALAILIEDGWPIFFVHRREGLGAREFGCIKFRSMRKDAEQIKNQLCIENEADGPQFFMEVDPRVTCTGRLIRKLNIDELPQFINVLFGDMSVVGPRPSPYSENQCCPSWREARLSVRPGITGLWQVMRTRRRGLDFQEWIQFDLQYVELRSSSSTSSSSANRSHDDGKEAFMSLRPKTRRRLLLLSWAASRSLPAGGAYAIVELRINARLIAGRAEGMEASEGGDYETALHKVGAYLQRHPDDVETLFVYSQCRLEVEDADGKYVKQAIAGFRQLLSLRPDHDGARHKLLDIFVRTGLNSEALDAADLLLTHDPKDLEALKAKASALTALCRFDEAKDVADAHHRLRPLDVQMQYLSLQLMEAKNEPAAAIVDMPSNCGISIPIHQRPSCC